MGSNIYQQYRKMMKLLQLNYCILTEQELMELYNQEKLDIDKLFLSLKDISPIIPGRDIDNFVVNHLNIWQQYQKDIYFQYAYMIVSKYIFEDKKDFLKYLKNIYSNMYDLNINQLNQVIHEVSKKDIAKFEATREQLEITQKLNNLFHNELVLNIIHEKLNDKEFFQNVFASCIENVKQMIEKIIFSVFLFKENITEEEVLQLLLEDKKFYDYIQDKIIKQLDIKNKDDKQEKQKVLHFIYHQLIEEGYYLHGTDSVNRKNILNNGFSSVKIPILGEQIRQINDIFEHHNLYMNFEGKVRELKLHQYYVTDSIASSITYAFQSPEYLSRFCSNGYHQENIKIFDREAFWRRDYKACKKNIELLCDHYNFTPQESTIVLQDFKELWDSTVSEKSIPMIFIGKKSNIGRNNSEKFTRINRNIEQYNIIDIIKLFESGDNIHDKRLSSINKESITYLSLPNIHTMYHLTSFDKSYSKQYIMYENKKYYPDILISKNHLTKRAIVISEDISNLEQLNNQLIMIPQNKEELSITLNKYCKVNLDYLIAGSGIALTEKGQQKIEALRKNISLSDVIKYNEKIIEDCITYWDKNAEYLTDLQKMELVCFIINEWLVGTISMKKYKKYFADIDEALNQMIYYSVDRGNKLSKIRKQKTIDNDCVSEAMKLIKEIVKNHYEPYYKLMSRFYSIEPR